MRQEANQSGWKRRRGSLRMGLLHRHPRAPRKGKAFKKHQKRILKTHSCKEGPHPLGVRWWQKVSTKLDTFTQGAVQVWGRGQCVNELSSEHKLKPATTVLEQQGQVWQVRDPGIVIIRAVHRVIGSPFSAKDEADREESNAAKKAQNALLIDAA